MSEKGKEKTGQDEEKKKPAARDPRGVRINNYSETTNGRQSNQKGDPEQTRVLLETFRRGFLGEVKTEEGGVVVQRRGQPPKYPTISSFVDAINDYLEYINDTFNNTGVELIPDVEGLCAFIGISRDTLNEWERSRPPEYSDVIKAVKTQIAAYKKQLGMQGRIPAVVLAIDFNNNHGYLQQQTIDIRATNKAQELPSAEDIVKKLPKKDLTEDTGGDDLTELL